MDIESYWEYIKSASTPIKRELILRLEHAIKSETEQRKRLYDTPQWKKKRLEILERDKHICQICGCKAQDVHHIKYFSNEPWDIDNDYLVSLCKECHSKFNVTSSNDYVFIPSPKPILLNKYDDKYCQLFSDEVLDIPKWNKIKPVLESFSYRTNYAIKELELAIYYPLYSKIWRKYVLKDFDGCDELDAFMNSIRYSPSELISHINVFERKKSDYPFLSKSFDFVISKLKTLYEQNRSTPQEGLFVCAVRNKKSGYYIKIINIAERKTVMHVDLSENNEYKTVSVSEQHLIGVLYAIDFLNKRCIEGDSCYSYNTPIFATCQRGLLCSFHYKNLYWEYMNKKRSSSSCR